MHRNLCFLDLETTGLEHEHDSIIEISFFVQDKNGKEIDRLDEVIIPTKTPLTPFTTSLTGITEEEIEKNGKNWEDIKKTVAEKIGNCVIVGHNIDFDIRFLKEFGIPLEDNPRIDTHELARVVLVNEETYSLEVLTEKHGIIHESAHRAMSDVLASAALYDILLEKINQLPSQYLEKIRPLLEKKTDWYAKDLFLNASHSTERADPVPASPENNISKNEITFPDFQREKEEIFTKWETENNVFVRSGDAHQTTALQLSVIKDLVNDGKKVAIITSKLDFFDPEKNNISLDEKTKLAFFPTPEVLVDSEKVEKFIAHRETLNDQETFFILQVKYRQFLGFRGKNFFDLFFHQKQLWKEIMAHETSDVFLEIVKERKEENLLVLTTNAFLRYRHLEIFQDRILIVDEAEDFAQDLLFFPSKTWSPSDLFENSENEKSMAAQFFVAEFCKKLEVRKGSGLSSFGEKVLFAEKETFPELLERVKALTAGEEQEKWLKFFNDPEPHTARWCDYFAQSGQLSFGAWDPKEWRSVQTDLEKWKKILFFRQAESTAETFFRVFTKITPTETLYFESLFSEKTFEVPDNLLSSRSPDFPHFCAKKIEDIATEHFSDSDEKNWIVANFSSQSTMKIAFDFFAGKNPADFSVLGERMSGGDSKMLQMMERFPKVLLFTQRMHSPVLGKFPFTQLIVQKFPFDPPHPLLDFMKQQWESGNTQLSFWDLWIIPRVTANLSLRSALYPKLKKIIWLDPSENAKWGKPIIQGAFPEIFNRPKPAPEKNHSLF
jgi:DNA polymerase III epsilon subunit-like protein